MTQLDLKNKTRGRIGELIAMRLLLQNGFQVFDAVVDEFGIDFVVRVPLYERSIYREVQVKYSTPNDNKYFFGVGAKTFEATPDRFFFLVLEKSEEYPDPTDYHGGAPIEHDILVIPSEDIKKYSYKIKKGDLRVNISIGVQDRHPTGYFWNTKYGKKETSKYVNNFSLLRESPKSTEDIHRDNKMLREDLLSTVSTPQPSKICLRGYSQFGILTIRRKDRRLFPEDYKPFNLEIDGVKQVKHVASSKISGMKDFFDKHSGELQKGDFHLTILIIKELKEYKLIID